MILNTHTHTHSQYTLPSLQRNTTITFTVSVPINLPMYGDSWGLLYLMEGWGMVSGLAGTWTPFSHSCLQVSASR